MTALLRRALLVGLVLVAVSAAVNSRQQPSAPADAARRITERLAALRREAEELATQQKSILTELRKLEVERQIKAEELSAIETEAAGIRHRLSQATARTANLRHTAAAAQPDVEDRLVRLYKMGRAGYWRLLLDVGTVQSMGRAYRTAAAMTRADRDRVLTHRQTLLDLERERGQLEARTAELVALQSRAAAARAALAAAVASTAAMVQTIGARRDLTTQLAAELDAAHLRLQSAVAQRTAGGTPAVPFRPFRGDLPWPADGIVVSRFGRERSSRVAGIEFNRNGIELSLPDGRAVTAVHDGVVTHAGPFAGLGRLVVVDQGGGVTLYGHLASTSVNTGDRVAAGTNVGTSGRNPGGNPSLYFELRVDGKPVDPLQWLRRQ